jgi:hypothetical protein
VRLGPFQRGDFFKMDGMKQGKEQFNLFFVSGK